MSSFNNLNKYWKYTLIIILNFLKTTKRFFSLFYYLFGRYCNTLTNWLSEQQHQTSVLVTLYSALNSECENTISDTSSLASNLLHVQRVKLEVLIYPHPWRIKTVLSIPFSKSKNVTVYRNIGITLCLNFTDSQFDNWQSDILYLYTTVVLRNFSLFCQPPYVALHKWYSWTLLIYVDLDFIRLHLLSSKKKKNKQI